MIHRKVTLSYSEANVLILETHRLKGKLHRAAVDGPAYIRRDEETGALREELYCWKGRLHREEGPARLEYNENGVAVVEWHCRHGWTHRDPKQGPARIERNETGTILLEESYCVNGWLYRDPADGPCQILREEDGQVSFESYYQWPRSTADRQRGVPPKTPSPR
jgi:hypothetical protein